MFFQYILSAAYGFAVSSYVPGHNFSHHKETQTLKDSMRTSKARFRWNFLNQLLFFPIVAKTVFNCEVRWVAKMKIEKPSWYAQWRNESIFVITLHAAVLLINWQAALLFIVLPHLYGAWGIVGCNVWQHDGCDEHHPHNHTRSFTSPLFNFFIMNNGFHGAHHDRPGLHWSLLPEYHRQHIAPYVHPNLNRKSLLKFLWETNIYPGIRVDYLGNKMAVPAVFTDEDWVEGIKVGDKKHRLDFGAEESTVEDILDINEVHETHIKAGKEISRIL